MDWLIAHWQFFSAAILLVNSEFLASTKAIKANSNFQLINLLIKRSKKKKRTKPKEAK